MPTQNPWAWAGMGMGMDTQCRALVSNLYDEGVGDGHNLHFDVHVYTLCGIHHRKLVVCLHMTQFCCLATAFSRWRGRTAR